VAGRGGGGEKERISRGSLLALPRHLSTTRPCSPGEKTRQPTPRTHLVSSGPSIRRGPSLALHLSLASSLFSPYSVFLLSPSLSLSLSLSRPNVFTVSPPMVPLASRLSLLLSRLISFVTRLVRSPSPSPHSLSLSLFLSVSLFPSFVGDTKARIRREGITLTSRGAMLIGDRRQLSNYRHSGRSRA